jgi:xanthine dehydrogenase accessory factor
MDLNLFLTRNPGCVLVEIVEALGSTPREAGAVMLVSPKAIWGTIGGGQLEYMAIDNARALLQGHGTTQMDVPLGPEIGQCCGGRTGLAFSLVSASLAAKLLERARQAEDARPGVFLFGAGHVGGALARALSPLPFAVTVVETRKDALDDLPASIPARLAAMPEAEVEDIPPGGAAIILTHDHALDFLIAERALKRGDLTYVGMIGSATKRATFGHWVRRQVQPPDLAAGLMARLVLPVGGTLVRDKRPPVIAAMVAAELLQVYAQQVAAIGSERATRLDEVDRRL